jgi:curli biogenesis system outer membrane secretion channel CsgG
VGSHHLGGNMKNLEAMLKELMEASIQGAENVVNGVITADESNAAARAIGKRLKAVQRLQQSELRQKTRLRR